MKIHYPSVLRRHLLFILFGLLTVIAYSQETESCAERLKVAESLFTRGQVDQVPSMLTECMKSGFNREESLTAYKLLVQAYLFDDKQDLADSTMLAFLSKNPEYELSPTDHSSFVYLFNTFRVKPVVQISIHFGTNVPFLTFVNENSHSSEPVKSFYNMEAVNLFTSVEAKFELSKKLEFNVETGYSQLSYTNTEPFMGFGESVYKETIKRVELPVSITYNLMRFNKLTLYGRLGLGPAFTIGSTAKAEFNPTDINNPYDRSGPDIDRKDSRISMDLFTQLGAGVKYKTPGGYLLAELRSNLGIFNHNTKGGASSYEPDYHYFSSDNDFHFNSLNISVGYTQLFYKPSKRKE